MDTGLRRMIESPTHDGVETHQPCVLFVGGVDAKRLAGAKNIEWESISGKIRFWMYQEEDTSPLYVGTTVKNKDPSTKRYIATVDLLFNVSDIQKFMCACDCIPIDLCIVCVRYIRRIRNPRFGFQEDVQCSLMYGYDFMSIVLWLKSQNILF